MILYECDPEKNTACEHTICRSAPPPEGISEILCACHETKHPEFAKFNADGNPIVTYISEDEIPTPIEEG